MPTAVALLQCTGVFGWACPISLRMLQKIIPVWQLWNKAPNSASAADATTKRITLVLTWNALLIRIGSPSLGNHPMKK